MQDTQTNQPYYSAPKFLWDPIPAIYPKQHPPTAPPEPCPPPQGIGAETCMYQRRLLFVRFARRGHLTTGEESAGRNDPYLDAPVGLVADPFQHRYWPG